MCYVRNSAFNQVAALFYPTLGTAFVAPALLSWQSELIFQRPFVFFPAFLKRALGFKWIWNIQCFITQVARLYVPQSLFLLFTLALLLHKVQPQFNLTKSNNITQRRCHSNVTESYTQILSACCKHEGGQGASLSHFHFGLCQKCKQSCHAACI